MTQQPNTCTRHYISHCLTLTKKVTTHEGPEQHAELNHGVDLWQCYSLKKKTVPSWSKNSGPVTCLQDGHQEDTIHHCMCCSILKSI